MLVDNRLVFMQRCVDAATHGFTHYTMGQTSDYEALQERFDGLYETGISKATRSRRRRSGAAVAMVYGCPAMPLEPTHKVTWILLVTPGKGRVHQREQLKPIQAERIRVGSYEMVHDGVSWSWQMTRERFGYWRDRIHSIASLSPDRRQFHLGPDGQREDRAIEEVMDALYRQPGFRLIRRQVGKLVSFARGEWRRLRPRREPLIRTRTFLPYVQRLPNQRTDMSTSRATQVNVA
jgi:hypothetical protein